MMIFMLVSTLFFFPSLIRVIDAPHSLVDGTKKLVVFFDHLKFACVTDPN